MKVRATSNSVNSKRLARRIARQDAEIADLKAQLPEALQRIDKLEPENTRLRDESAQLKQQLAAARKDSWTSSKPPSSDIVKPKKREARAGRSGSVAGSDHVSPLIIPSSFADKDLRRLPYRPAPG